MAKALSNRKDAGNLAPIIPFCEIRSARFTHSRVVFDSGAKADPNAPGPHVSIALLWPYGARSCAIGSANAGARSYYGSDTP
jgi:hypothetical protein